MNRILVLPICSNVNGKMVINHYNYHYIIGCWGTIFQTCLDTGQVIRSQTGMGLLGSHNPDPSLGNVISNNDPTGAETR